MKILMLSDGIPPFVMGGMQKHTKLFVEQLAQRGHTVHLFHYTYQLFDNKTILQEFAPDCRENLSITTFLYEDHSRLPGHYLRAQKRMSKLYFDQLSKLAPFDFIYTKGFMGWYLLENRSKLNYQCKIGVKFHGMNMYQKQADLKGELQKYILRPAVKQIMTNADVVFSYGGGITKIIEEVIGDRRKILELPTAIDSKWLIHENEISAPSKTRKFLFIGRYDRVKGLPELYKALELLDNETLEWEFHFVGPIPPKNQFNHDSCHYYGKIQDWTQLSEIVDQCDILVNASVSEGMPNVILEAMARGLAILATDVGATSLLVNENGWLLADNNPKAIFQSLKAAIKIEDSTLMKMKTNSRMRVESFNWNEIMSSFEDALDN